MRKTKKYIRNNGRRRWKEEKNKEIHKELNIGEDGRKRKQRNT